MSKNDRYVSETADGGWDVRKEGHRRATARASTQRDAIERARRIVRNEGGGEIRVMNRSGKIMDSKTVARPPSRSKDSPGVKRGKR